MRREAIDALKLLDGETPAEVVEPVPASSLSLHHITDVVRLLSGPVWRVRVRFTLAGVTQAAPHQGRALRMAAQYLMRDTGAPDKGEFWRYDRAMHHGQVMIPLSDDEFDFLTVTERNAGDENVPLGSYHSERSVLPSPQN